MLSPETSDFRPAFKNQLNFDYPHNEQIIFMFIMKSSKIRPPTLKSRQFELPTQKTSQL